MRQKHFAFFHGLGLHASWRSAATPEPTTRSEAHERCQANAFEVEPLPTIHRAHKLRIGPVHS
eukprot:3036949-Amphidinium_carterae.1